jgi:hypothetical protein
MALSNVFEVIAHVKTLPESVDPKKCRVSGYIIGSNGAPIEGVRLSFAPKLDVVVKGDDTVAPSQPLMVTTDKDGYLEFDLLRGLEYEAYFNSLMVLAGQQPPRLDVVVPNLPSAELDDLLYPIPVSLSLSEDAITIAKADGANDDVEAEIQFSDGSIRTKMTPWATVQLQVSDDLVLKASLLEGKLVLTPLSVGTATVTSIRKIVPTASFDPEPVYATDTITVTVTA